MITHIMFIQLPYNTLSDVDISAIVSPARRGRFPRETGGTVKFHSIWPGWWNDLSSSVF